MSRTVFQNACVAAKIPFASQIDFERPELLITRVDDIGALIVPATYFLATYHFQGRVFYGVGTGKRHASENLFNRIITSSFLPTTPPKIDPTEAFPSPTFSLTFSSLDRKANLVVSSLSSDPHVFTSEIPKGRYEALLSLVRHVMRGDD